MHSMDKQNSYKEPVLRHISSSLDHTSLSAWQNRRLMRKSQTIGSNETSGRESLVAQVALFEGARDTRESEVSLVTT